MYYFSENLYIVERKVNSSPSLHLHPKHLPNFLPQLLFYGFHILWCSQFFYDGCYGFVGKSAGVDMAEVFKIGIYIEGKAVHAHPAAGANSYGTDLTCAAGAVIKPHVRSTIKALGFQVIVMEQVYDRLLQLESIVAHPGYKILQVENGIIHNLPGAVVSDIASAIDMEKFGFLGLQLDMVDEQVFGRTALSKGVHMEIFVKQKVVGCYLDGTFPVADLPLEG